MEDFNKILSVDKMGGRIVNLSNIGIFNDCIVFFGLRDLGFGSTNSISNSSEI